MNQEYEILKNELISCREKHYSNKYSLIALISTLLTISFFVYEHLENSYLQGDKYAQRINVYIVIVEILAFVVPLVVLLCCSIKEHRNYRKMIFISLYIQVVYEYPSLKR